MDCCNSKGETLFSTQTLGLNPQVLSSAILKERIINNFDLYQNRNEVTHLYFYGAGCGVDSPQKRIRRVFDEIFINSKIVIKEDTYAAVYAAADMGEKSIVCILGTGSNCTYFDGKEIEFEGARSAQQRDALDTLFLRYFCYKTGYKPPNHE